MGCKSKPIERWEADVDVARAVPESRSKTVTWEDPLIGARAGAAMSGLDYMSAIARGDVPPPPVAMLLGFRRPEVEPGRATFQMEPSEEHFNPIGVVHGGIIATLLDSAMGCAVHTTCAEGTAYTTLEFKVNLVRAVTLETGLLRAEGIVTHRGRRIATAEARVTSPDGRLIATATTTCLIMEAAGR